MRRASGPVLMSRAVKIRQYLNKYKTFGSARPQLIHLEAYIEGRREEMREGRKEGGREGRKEYRRSDQ